MLSKYKFLILNHCLLQKACLIQSHFQLREASGAPHIMSDGVRVNKGVSSSPIQGLMIGHHCSCLQFLYKEKKKRLELGIFLLLPKLSPLKSQFYAQMSFKISRAEKNRPHHQYYFIFLSILYLIKQLYVHFFFFYSRNNAI